MSLERIVALARKEVVHLRRDPVSLRILFILPVVQLVLIGYVARLDVDNIPTAICDEDHTEASLELATQITASRYFTCVAAPADHRQLKAILDQGRARVGILIPRGYQRAIAGGRPAQIGLVLDGSDATTAQIAMSYLQGMLAAASLRTARRVLLLRGIHAFNVPVALRPTILYNPNLRSRDYMIPGVVGLVILVLLLSLSAVAIVRERELGTLERLLMAPISPAEFMVGKLLPFLAVGMIDVAIVLSVARFWFHVPIRGSIIFLYAAALLFAINILGIGLVTSAIARTQQQAILTNIFIIMPSILLSGFVAPIRNMPLWLQYLTYAIPLRYFLVIVRGICLKGLTPVELWPQLAALAGLGLAAVVVGSTVMRGRL